MNISTIIKAWKDDEYRNSLSAAEMALLPESPVGMLELTDDDLAQVAGGRKKKSRSRSRRSRTRRSRTRRSRS